MLKTTLETSPIPNPKSRSAKLFQAQLSQKISQNKKEGLRSCINPKTKNSWKHKKLKTDFASAVGPVSRNSKTYTKSNQVSLESCYDDSNDYHDWISTNP